MSAPSISFGFIIFLCILLLPTVLSKANDRLLVPSIRFESTRMRGLYLTIVHGTRVSLKANFKLLDTQWDSIQGLSDPDGITFRQANPAKKNPLYITYGPGYIVEARDEVKRKSECTFVQTNGLYHPFSFSFRTIASADQYLCVDENSFEAIVSNISMSSASACSWYIEFQFHGF